MPRHHAPHVPSACSPTVSARDDRPHGNAAVGATYCPPPARSRGLPESGPPILSRPLRAIEGATSDPAPGRAGHGNAHSGTGRGSTPHTRRRAAEEATQHRHLTHRHRQMETHTSTSTQASHRQQRHTLRFLRRRTRLRIHAQTKQRRSRPHNPLQQGRNRHTRQHNRDLPMVQPTQRQRTQPNRSTTQNDRAGNKHRMVTACITGGLALHTHTSSSAGGC